MRYITLLGIILVFSGCYNLRKHEIGSSEEAETVAQKMWKAAGQDKWKSTNVITFNFKLGNRFEIWDKQRDFVYVKWKENEVWLNMTSMKGIAHKEGKVLEGKDKEKLLKGAYDIWINDSFWMNPVAKIYDQGVERKLVDYKGDTTFLVEYTQGGNTPGDRYLWILDENGLPMAWRLWVSIVPVKGVKFTWEDWITTETGVKVSTLHKSSLMDLELDQVHTAYNINDLFEQDPFDELTKLE